MRILKLWQWQDLALNFRHTHTHTHVFCHIGASLRRLDDIHRQSETREGAARGQSRLHKVTGTRFRAMGCELDQINDCQIYSTQKSVSCIRTRWQLDVHTQQLTAGWQAPPRIHGSLTCFLTSYSLPLTHLFAVFIPFTVIFITVLSLHRLSFYGDKEIGSPPWGPITSAATGH
jgi:hypothetical protein